MKKRNIKRLAKKMQTTCYCRVTSQYGINKTFVCVDCPYKDICFELYGTSKLMFYTVNQVENMIKERF